MGLLETPIPHPRFPASFLEPRPPGPPALSQIAIWENGQDQPRLSLTPSSGHKERVTCVTQLTYNEEVYIVSSSRDKTIGLWDLKADAPLFLMEGHEGPVNHVAMDDQTCASSPDLRPRAVSCDSNGEVRFWDVTRGTCLCVIHLIPGRTLTSVLFTHCGRYVVAGVCAISAKLGSGGRLWTGTHLCQRPRARLHRRVMATARPLFGEDHKGAAAGGQGFFRIIKSQGGGGALPQNPLPPSPDQSDHSGKKRNLQ